MNMKLPLMVLLKYCICSFVLFLISFTALGQRLPIRGTLEYEEAHRKGKPFSEEKYYKNGRLDSVYRKWNSQKQLLTEGYYVQGKRHGPWREWMSIYQRHNYLLFIYDQGVLIKAYKYVGWAKGQDSVKSREHFYTLEPNDQNFTAHTIMWNTELGGKKTKNTS